MPTGSCLCGAISFDIDAIEEKIEACHCDQCRRWTTHFLACVEAEQDALHIQDDTHLKWFHSSDKARRGFCGNCGTPLFFDPLDKDKHSWIGISAGALDKPTGAKIGLHIFTSEKGDYYEIKDDVQQNAR